MIALSFLPAQDAGTAAVACGASTRVGPADSARLPVSARQNGRSRRSAVCELADGHQGSHMAFLTASGAGERWWWLSWGPPNREVVQIDPCPIEDSSSAYRDDCLLPASHVGPHSFDLRPAEQPDALSAPH